MLLYNQTLIIEDGVAEEWVLWMQGEHIPKIMATGLFISNRLLKVIDSPNEGVTFCAQYVAEHPGDYEIYQAVHAPALQDELNTRFKDKFVVFSTLMEYIA